jgi:hypothetical protein
VTSVLVAEGITELPVDVDEGTLEGPTELGPYEKPGAVISVTEELPAVLDCETGPVG